MPFVGATKDPARPFEALRPAPPAAGVDADPSPRPAAAEGSRPELAAPLLSHWSEDDDGPAAPRSPGVPLSDGLRAPMEARLGADLSAVRVHTGAAASSAADGYDAEAFTVGSDIHFADAQCDLNGREGSELLAHELTHTVQAQKAGASHGGAAAHEVSHPDEPGEKEAEAVARHVVGGSGGPLPAISALPGAGGRVMCAGRRGGERRQTARPDGTDNPFKHMRPDPTDSTKVLVRDNQTGKTKRMAKPAGFDEWWAQNRGER